MQHLQGKKDDPLVTLAREKGQFLVTSRARQAGMVLEAGQLFLAHARTLSAQSAVHHLVAASAQKALDCSKLARLPPS